MSFLNNPNILNHLVSETFREPVGARELFSYKLNFYKSISCYQLEVDGSLYTFPSNWGPFLKVHKREGDGLILENDLEGFNSVFGSLAGKDMKVAFIYMGDETFLVFVPKKMEIILSDLHLLISDITMFKLSA